MALARWERPIQDAAGNLLTSVWCEVRKEDVSGNPLAQLYSDRDGAAPLSNPFLATDGIPAFHAVGGSYRVRVYKAGYDETFRYQAVGTGAEVDLNALLEPGYLFAFETPTSAPPGEGAIRANHENLSLATALYISRRNTGGSDISARIAALSGQRLVFTSQNLGEQFTVVAGAVTPSADHLTVAVSGHAGASTVAAGGLSLQREAGADGKFSGTEVIKTSAYAAVAADVGKIIALNKATADTLSFPAAATLGAAWMVMVKNIAAGVWTLTPAGGETIDGAASISLASGESCVIASNGTALRSLFRSRVVGTGAGTVAAGDDSRITGAIQSSLLTTRGDIIVRGASAPARLALGAVDRLLRSDGTDLGYGQLTAGMVPNSLLTFAMLASGALASNSEMLQGTAGKLLSAAILKSAVAFQTLTDTTNIAWDMALGNNAQVVLGGNRTGSNITNVTPQFGFVLKLTATGATRTWTPGSQFVPAAGVEAFPISITTTETVYVVGFVDTTTRFVITGVIRT